VWCVVCGVWCVVCVCVCASERECVRVRERERESNREREGLATCNFPGIHPEAGPPSAEPLPQPSRREISGRATSSGGSDAGPSA